MFFSKSTVVSLSLLAASQLVAGHSAIVAATGDQGGQGSAIGVDPATPRDGTRRQPFQQDATRFKNEAADQCGETLGGGTNDVEAGTQGVMAQNGGTLPQVSQGGTLSMTVHQVNGDGAGPYTCMIDATGTGTQWTPMQVTTNIEGSERGRNRDTEMQDLPLDVAIPADQQCTGTNAGQTNVCMVRCENPARAGPFGGCVPIQMANATAAAPAAAAAPVANAAAPVANAASPVANAAAPVANAASPVANAAAPVANVASPVANAAQAGNAAAPVANAASPVANAAQAGNAATPVANAASPVANAAQAENVAAGNAAPVVNDPTAAGTAGVQGQVATPAQAPAQAAQNQVSAQASAPAVAQAGVQGQTGVANSQAGTGANSAAGAVTGDGQEEEDDDQEEDDDAANDKRSAKKDADGVLLTDDEQEEEVELLEGEEAKRWISWHG
ncbi:hypothetical protein BDV95DRAFT_169951 [Massariosphaeria phaeospora]|uniref:Uncharacterized protein n=1 Tax=Massariosphaeria phaeospora TaxID=100035 RepID=A0A7C8I0Q7_9PLEO|nr:hypothetical protein BDV95DRAFT_169951 [Massariosphaeria phaeospora]